MQIHIGYELIYMFTQPTPMLLALNVHYSRASDIVVPDHMVCTPSTRISSYRDTFGNWCNRLVAPQGRIRITSSGVINDTGAADLVWPSAEQVALDSLPDDVLVYLLGSRYCETDHLAEVAWELFKDTPPGWRRVQAICDFVHGHITFGYPHARSTKTAREVFNERRGVCRDYAHLAIAFCRCMNIPARYCTGYLGDIGVPPPHSIMDFAAWFEAYLEGGWYVFDPRNNIPRMGRILIARGRDAADTAFATTFGPNVLESFSVWTDELKPSQLGSIQKRP